MEGPTLDLSFQEITPTYIKALAEKLRNNTSITHLDMRETNIDDTSVFILVDVLQTTNITSINFSFNNIGLAGCSALIKLATLKELYLIENNLTYEDTCKLLEVLKENTSLIDFQLCDYNINNYISNCTDDLMKRNRECSKN